MKKISFIETLVDEEKINLVDPSMEISSSYTKKSDNALKAAKLLLPHNLLEEATSLIYYAMYNKLLSLLFRVGIKSKSHAGSIILLKELFSVSNSSISFAKRERVDKQYYVDVTTTQQEVKKLLESGEEFVAEIDFYTSKLDSKKVQILRDEFFRTYLE